MRRSASWICVLQSKEGLSYNHDQSVAAMHIRVKPRPLSDHLLVVLLCFVLLNCAGCAYFRPAPKTDQEQEQQNKEKQQEQKQLFTPGSDGSSTI